MESIKVESNRIGAHNDRSERNDDSIEGGEKVEARERAEQARRALEQAQKLAAEAQKLAAEGYDTARRLASDGYEQAQKYAKELQQVEVREYVRREPLKAVAIAFAAGYVAARLLRRIV